MIQTDTNTGSGEPSDGGTAVSVQPLLDLQALRSRLFPDGPTSRSPPPRPLTALFSPRAPLGHRTPFFSSGARTSDGSKRSTEILRVPFS